MKLPLLIFAWILLMGLGELTIQHLDESLHDVDMSKKTTEESQWLSFEPGHSREDILNYFQYEIAHQEDKQLWNNEKI